MFFKFLSHQLAEFRRGRNKARDLGARVVLLIFILYFLLIAIALGFYMDRFLEIAIPEKEPVLAFYGIILYYFIVDFLIRIAMQKLPTLSVQPYLTLNIRKKTLVNFLNTKSLLNFFNLIPILFFFPFCFGIINETAGIMSALVIMGCILSLSVFNNFMVLWLKRQSGSREWILLTGGAIVMGFGVLDYFRIISVMDFSGHVFSAIAVHPYLALIFLGMAILAYLTNKKYLINNLYIEELSTGEKKKESTDYPYFNRFGRVGILAASELKLILRHKRSKSMLTVSVFMICYGLLFYEKDVLDANRFGMILFAAIFITGVFQMSYGQLMFAWQSNHFDGLMANRIDVKDFLKAKFLLFTLAATMVTMVSFLYGVISWKLIFIHLCVLFYTIGFGSVIILYFACYNKKRLDLSRGTMMNWQGMSAIQWIQGIPLILLPYLIYLPFSLTGAPYWGIIAIGIFGLITLAMRELWIKWLTQLFSRQRYNIAEGFRE